MQTFLIGIGSTLFTLAALFGAWIAFERLSPEKATDDQRAI